MGNKAIYESNVEYYVDYAKTLHIFVNGYRAATITDVESDNEHLNELVDEVLFDLGYTYII